MCTHEVGHTHLCTHRKTRRYLVASIDLHYSFETESLPEPGTQIFSSRLEFSNGQQSCLHFPLLDTRALGTGEVKGILGERSCLEYQGWVHRCVSIGSPGHRPAGLITGPNICCEIESTS